MSGLRQRRKPVAQVVTEFDAFPKIPETYVEQTTTGGSGRITDLKYIGQRHWTNTIGKLLTA